jgi:hypothetical protein
MALYAWLYLLLCGFLPFTVGANGNEAIARSVDSSIHLVYCSDLEGKQLMYFLRSVNSIIFFLHEDKRNDLMVHLFLGNSSSSDTELEIVRDRILSHSINHLKSSSLYLHRINESQIAPIKVWGPYAYKLSKPANFVRFYVPDFLYRNYEAERLLYLDTDTVAIGDIAILYNTVMPLQHSVVMGAQRTNVCTFGKLFDMKQLHLMSLQYDSNQLCLTASVMVVDIKTWVYQNMTRRVEYWIEQNNMHHLYKLGSMPPLMLALGTNWTVSESVIDAKGLSFSHLLKSYVFLVETKGKYSIVHPFKDLSSEELTSEIHKYAQFADQQQWKTILSILSVSGSSFSASNAHNLVNSSSSDVPLRIMMLSYSGCDCVHCQEKAGSVRIGICNYGNALKYLGNDVVFYSYDRLHKLSHNTALSSSSEPPQQSSEFDVVISYTPRRSKDVLHALCKNISLSILTDCPLLVFAKPHNQTNAALQQGLPIFDSMVHLQSALLGGYTPAGMDLIPVMKLLEVPTSYWRHVSNDTSYDLKNDRLYEYIPQHTAYTSAFHEHRKARLCYHGSPTHILSGHEANDLVDDLVSLYHESSGSLMEIFILTKSANRVAQLFDKKNASIIAIEYSTIDDAFHQLVSCDIGLVPNLMSPPFLNATSDAIYGGVVYDYKNSANGGRAFVFAQLGVPMVGHPEFEFVEVLAGAGIDKQDILVYGGTPHAWLRQIKQLLTHSFRRLEISKQLRAYAEKKLHIMQEGRRLETIIKENLQARADRLDNQEEEIKFS